MTTEYSVPGDTWRLHWAHLFCFQVECRIRACLGSCSLFPRPLVLPGRGSCAAHPPAVALHTAVPARCSLTAKPGPQTGVIKKGPFVILGVAFCVTTRSPCPPSQLVTTLPPAVGLWGPRCPSQDQDSRRPRWCECCSLSVQRSLPAGLSLGLRSALTLSTPWSSVLRGPCHPSLSHFQRPGGPCARSS